MSGIAIRPTAPSDLAALADVLVEVHAIDGYPVEGVDNPRSWVELPRAFGQWTGVLDHRPAGHVALLPPSPEDGAPEMLIRDAHIDLDQIAVLARLFVAPWARGHGLAGRLMDAVEAQACELGITTVLDVMQKDAAAVRLYETRGWQPLGAFSHIRPDRKSEPALAFFRGERTP